MSPKREEGVEAVWGFGGRREPRTLLTFILQSSLCTRPLGWWSCNMVPVVVVTMLSIQSKKREIIRISFAVAWGSACDKFVISNFQIGCCLSISTSLSHFWSFLPLVKQMCHDLNVKQYSLFVGGWEVNYGQHCRLNICRHIGWVDK